MTNLDRRTILRGAGAVMALPLLESLSTPARAGERAVSAPRRLVFVYAPNGVNREAWTPPAKGTLDALPPTLEPLAPWRADLLVVGGLALHTARANGDGPGDHARANAAFLTCSQPRKADGAIHVGVSIDQLVARRIGDRTRFRSIQLGCEDGAQSGQCDSGYACAYSSNLSWAGPSTPIPKEVDPRRLFDRLFRDGDLEESEEQRAERIARRRSVLDLVREDARRLATRLSTSDRRKLEEYQEAVRELERRLDGAARGGGDVPDSARPAGIPKDRGEHARLLADVLVLALAADATRIATFALANEGSNFSHRAIGVPQGHHEISHHGNDPAKRAGVALIDRFHVECFAHLVRRLAETEERGARLLDSVDVLYGSGIGDGNRHDHADLPVLLVGGGLRGGRHVDAAAGVKETPLANLHVTLARRAGAGVERFADSTGVVEFL
ncbi:MAG: DUF1552 domain-containing protein [Planctomycetes bacterium]|nr:DUF1552 domain-containing protein [Planctomycetota bacterium]